MKKLWRRKWLVIPAALFIFLSIGAAAWAATDGGQANDEAFVAEEAAAPVAAVSEDGDEATCGAASGDLKEALKKARADFRGAIREAGGDLREAVQAAREHWRDNRAEKGEALREEMTPQDQALYDDLLKQLEDQRAELREIREKMKEIAGELRELCSKYLTDED